MDELALVLEQGTPRGFLLRGWAALDASWSALAELELVLRNDKCSLTCPLVREPRYDVARVRGEPYLHSGYRALVPVEPLCDGEYRIIIALRGGEGSALLDTQATLHVRDGRPYLPGLQDRSLLQIVHVPKTGGTSFRQLLEQVFGSALSLHYEARLLVNADTRCIQGHNYASNFLQFMPTMRMVMWFRHPVERVISEYFHWRRSPELYPLDGEDLLRFAQRREMVNLHRRCLDTVPLQRLDCVCITEHFEASVALFCRMFAVGPVELSPQNTNPDKPVAEPYALPAELRAQIARANMADLELYARAEERFRALCRAHDIALPPAL